MVYWRLLGEGEVAPQPGPQRVEGLSAEELHQGAAKERRNKEKQSKDRHFLS